MRGLLGPNGWRGGAPQSPRPWGPLGAGSSPGLRGRPVPAPLGRSGGAGFSAGTTGGCAAWWERGCRVSPAAGEALARVSAVASAVLARGGEVPPSSIRSAVQDGDNVWRLLCF